MKLKTTLFAACVAFAISASSATASLTLTVTSTLVHNFGPDTFGFDGSIWTFTFSSSQDNYVPNFGFASATTDSAFLTVSGATDNAYNGTFAITETNTTNFASLPNVVGDLFVGLAANQGTAVFSFGSSPVTVSGLDLKGSPLSNPGSTAPIQLSDFQGASVSDSGVAISGGNFSFGSGTVNAAVPEPSTYAALAGLTALTFVMMRRRKV